MKKFLVLIMVLALMLPTVAFAEQLSLTTGLPTDKEYKAIAVQFDNSVGARPHYNMTRADVVYEMPIVSMNMTRYTAIFNDEIPELVEAVRSARIMHIDTAYDWTAAFVHFGGQQKKGSSIYDYVEGKKLVRFDGLTDGKNFYRDSKRKAPYNVFGRLAQMHESFKAPSAERVHTPLKFSAENPTIKGEDVTSFGINYTGSFNPSYVYDAEAGVYHRYYNGKLMKDGNDGAAYDYENVIVVTAEYSFMKNASDRPIVELLRTGNKAEYFIGGKHFTGSWSRKGITTSTVFVDDEGNEVQFKPGKTFIQVIMPETEIEING